ncbi:4e15b728-96b3-4570-89e3-63f7fd66d13a [Thermothielavioides terrestris]|uniref:4e15b728-96b3-4570-89e3-63f7fd66d13a n=1 Tax=Thermothielavioides terrestris TaxID=2587410 RepID=A0A3S5CWR2_9PEZI|nr:4e15b728-96b3-4570-89e3-63f7fd66d13a [Thermothielavioides terrestris]
MSQRTPKFPTRPVAQLLGSNGPVHAVAYSASPGTYILTGSSDRSIRLYNPSSTTTSTASTASSTNTITKPQHTAASQPAAPPTGRLIQTYASHAYEVLALSVSASNAHFASAGGDRAVLLWDVATAQTVRRFGAASTAHSHSGRVNAVCFAGADDSLVVSGGLDCTVRVWDVRAGGGSGGGGGKPVQVLSEARDAVSALAVCGPEIVAGSVDGRVRTYDVRAGRCVTDVLPASVTSVCLARDGRTVLVGSLDSKIRLMDRANGACLRTYGDAGWRNAELRVQSVLGGGERFVVAGDEMAATSGGGSEAAASEGRVWAWDLLTGRLVATVPVPWGNSNEHRKKIIGRDGKEKERKNVVSCIAWKDGGFGNQFCVGGTSGVVTVFGEG